MSTDRLVVRATARFFDDLDQQLGAERGRGFAVVGQLASDGAVELVSLELDVGPD